MLNAYKNHTCIEILTARMPNFSEIFLVKKVYPLNPIFLAVAIACQVVVDRDIPLRHLGHRVLAV